MDIRGCAALVTGGASGLGAATAHRLAGEGATVYAVDLPEAIERSTQSADADASDESAASSTDSGGTRDPGASGSVTLVAADVTNVEQVAAAVARVTEAGVPLRIVVNCAGIGPSARILGRKGVHELDLFRKVIEVNLVGTFNVLTQASAAMAQTSEGTDGQRGVVINTASVAAFDGQIGQAAYSASKGGVAALTLPAARDLASVGIRVCTIAPGIVDTPMLATISEEFRTSLAAGVPFPRRLARPDEYAQLAVMIVQHDYLNGETIRMDAALRMAPR